MPGELELDLDRFAAPDGDRLGGHLHRLPAAPVPVTGAAWHIRLVEVKVLLVHRENREAESQPPVVADGNAGKHRLPATDDVHAGADEVGEVAQRRDGDGPVRIVGQDRAAGSGAPPGDGPVVAAAGGSPALIGHLDTGGGQVVVTQDIRGDQRQVQPLGDDQPGVRFQQHPQGFSLGPELVQDHRPRHLAVDVAVKAVAADPQHVLRAARPPAGSRGSGTRPAAVRAPPPSAAHTR